MIEPFSTAPSPMSWIVVQTFSLGDPAYGSDDLEPDKPGARSIYSLTRRRHQFDWRKGVQLDDLEEAA